MTIRTLAVAAAASSLALAPIAAQAQPAAVERGSAMPAQTEDLQGGFGAIAIIIALAALGMGLLLLSDDDDAISA
jgi:hypothetical protein